MLGRVQFFRTRQLGSVTRPRNVVRRARECCGSIRRASPGYPDEPLWRDALEETMDKNKAKCILEYVVKSTEQVWKGYTLEWSEVDKALITNGFAQGGFDAWRFADQLRTNGMLSIGRIGLVLEGFHHNRSYSREVAGSLSARLYSSMAKGERGEEGRLFLKSVEEFRGARGQKFWKLMWYILVCCQHLRTHYEGSFSYYIRKKYGEYKSVGLATDAQLLEASVEDWDLFKRTEPWRELVGVGPNTFDYIFRDIVEANFASSLYKLDSANVKFLEATGLARLIGGIDRERVVSFLRELGLKYTLAQINRGLYVYCSKMERGEANEYGFCGRTEDCDRCGVKGICDKLL